ncbi:Protein QmcA [Lactobacillus helveticus]|uniref:SPFH domain-containing protein n=1 Tax=Lactobacillus helveticus TaxID=1587 RepID=UPI001567929F|nr:SPFH domain-containing protein [Lactobacillus helveticus]NRO82917.1 Protein QmcA [Lactobacillus helveticus]
MMARIIIGIIVVLVIVYVCCGFKIVPQNNEGLVETLGKYSKTVKAGFIFVWPLFQRIRKVPLALQPLEISTSLTLNYLVTDSYRYFYNNTDSVESMVQLIRGHLRDIIGRMDLNAALGSTKEINDQLFTATGDLTDIYGIKVVRVNVDELLPSAEIQHAMDKQLTADREKTAAIAKAEGEARTIGMTTKAKNDALVATAKANAEAVKTQADADAYRVQKMQEALSKAGEGYFRNQSLDSFNQLAQGPNNLIVVGKDEMTDLGKVPALRKVWDASDDKKDK